MNGHMGGPVGSGARVMLTYGTRPEAIKMAPLVRALRSCDWLEPIVTVTGQHREMLDQVNGLFDIVPDHDLDLMIPGATVADMNARMLTELTKVLQRDRPDIVVVQGDTTSALSGALAAFYERIPVVHLEAGLRTGDLDSPFPEEANRRLIAPITALHLAPTAGAGRNLEYEGIDRAKIAVTGNTVIDALHAAVGVTPLIQDEELAQFLRRPGPMILVTCHRRESWGDPMRSALRGLRRVLDRHPECRVLLPMHLNRIVREVVEPMFAGYENVLLTEPLGYHEFTHAISASSIVLTDSGGLQEEAPSLGKPVLVMRETTERPEAVEAGTVKLVGTDEERVFQETMTLIEDSAAHRAMANAVNPYGDGAAAARSVAAIRAELGLGMRLPDYSSTETDTWPDRDLARENAV